MIIHPACPRGSLCVAGPADPPHQPARCRRVRNRSTRALSPSPPRWSGSAGGALSFTPAPQPNTRFTTEHPPFTGSAPPATGARTGPEPTSGPCFTLRRGRLPAGNGAVGVPCAYSLNRL